MSLTWILSRISFLLDICLPCSLMVLVVLEFAFLQVLFIELWRSCWYISFIKVGVVSADVNVFLEDLISFMFELSLSWNSQFISWKFIFSTILNKSFWSCSKNLMGDGILTIVACIILLKIKSFPSHSLYHRFSLFKQF